MCFIHVIWFISLFSLLTCFPLLFKEGKLCSHPPYACLFPICNLWTTILIFPEYSVNIMSLERQYFSIPCDEEYQHWCGSNNISIQHMVQKFCLVMLHHLNGFCSTKYTQVKYRHSLFPYHLLYKYPYWALILSCHGSCTWALYHVTCYGMFFLPKL
jgi:hypothetical protein